MRKSHAVALSIEVSKSLVRRRFRLSQANVRSMTHRRGSNTKPLAVSAALHEASLALRERPHVHLKATSILPAPRTAGLQSTPPPKSAALGRRTRPELRREGRTARWRQAPRSTTRSGTIGVPTAPNETPAAWPRSARTSALRGGKPSTTSIGAVSATGVPNPAAPSRNMAKNQASNRATICGLAEVDDSHCPIRAVAPVRS